MAAAFVFAVSLSAAPRHVLVVTAVQGFAHSSRPLAEKVIAGESGGLFDWFDDDSSSDESRMGALFRRVAGAPLAGRLGAPEGDVETFLGSVAPLISGEKTLAALPFVMLLH